MVLLILNKIDFFSIQQKLIKNFLPKNQWSVCETSGRKGLNAIHGRN